MSIGLLFLITSILILSTLTAHSSLFEDLFDSADAQILKNKIESSLTQGDNLKASILFIFLTLIQFILLFIMLWIPFYQVLAGWCLLVLLIKLIYSFHTKSSNGYLALAWQNGIFSFFSIVFLLL